MIWQTLGRRLAVVVHASPSQYCKAWANLFYRVPGQLRLRRNLVSKSRERWGCGKKLGENKTKQETQQDFHKGSSPWKSYEQNPKKGWKCENHARTIPRMRCLQTEKMSISKLICRNPQTKPKLYYSELSEGKFKNILYLLWFLSYNIGSHKTIE